MTVTEKIAECGVNNISACLYEEMTPLEKRLYINGVADMMKDAINAVEISHREDREEDAEDAEEFDWHTDDFPETPNEQMTHDGDKEQNYAAYMSDDILVKLCDGNYCIGNYCSKPDEDRGFWIHDVTRGTDMMSRTKVDTADVVAWMPIPEAE